MPSNAPISYQLQEDLTLKGVSPPQPRKLKALERNNLKWKRHRDEIRDIYINQGKTLKETMKIFEHRHGFKKCERKWKEKIKEWKLTKKVPTKDMSIMVAKAEKRKIDQGKDTLFHHNGIKVAHHKIEKIKKERVSQSQNVTSSIPDTPSSVKYHTPLPETGDDHARTTMANIFPEVFEETFPQPDNKLYQGNRSQEWTSSLEQESFAVVALDEDHVNMDLQSTPLSQTDQCKGSCQCNRYQKVANVFQAMDEVDDQSLVIEDFINKARTLDCKNTSDCLELQRHLAIVAQGLKGSWHYKREVIQLSLICFAWDLERYLDGGETATFAESIGQLYTATTAIFSSHPYMAEVLACIRTTYLGVVTYERLVALLKPSNIQLLQAISSSLLQLARACSFANWTSIAELLFKVLLQRDRIQFEIDRVNLHIEYCYHLKRQRSWTELLPAVHKAFKVLINGGYRMVHKTRLVEIALDDVPVPLEQFMAVERVHEMLDLREEVRKRWRSFGD